MIITNTFDDGRISILGSSQETKPNDCVAGSRFTESDTGNKTIFTGTGWVPDPEQPRVKNFSVSAEIVRPANTTPYAAGQIINGNGATALVELDFSQLCYGGQGIQLCAVSILDENGAASVKLSAQVHLFNTAILTGQNLADGQLFTPSYAELKLKREGSFDDLSTLNTFGNSAYLIAQTEVQRLVRLSSQAKLYAAIVTNNAYTPGSGKKLSLIVKGFIL